MDKIIKNEIENQSMRLVKFISNCGIASRRKAGDLVTAKRIKVNGELCLDMSYQVQPSDIVEFDNQQISLEARKIYIMLNKPVDYVCTNSDLHAELKAIDLIAEATEFRLYSAGRLDKDSEGLILFSNDGDFVKKVTHPSHQVLKKYEVTTKDLLTSRDIYQITSGKICDEDDFLKAESVKLLSQAEKRYLFVLNEGKKREIRRLVKWCKNRVVALKRIAIGELELGSLETGKYRELSPKEIELALKNT